MRRAVLVLLFCMVACDARNGTYLEVAGTAQGVEFDRVEFFFGTAVGTSVPFTPEHPFQQVTPSGRDKVAKRRYVTSDNQHGLERGMSLTYYLDPDPENAEPTYVLALAYLGDQAVGIAEVDGLELRDDGRYVYDLTLTPIASEDVERWGSVDADATDCVRWTRIREEGKGPSTYAVVRGDDRDCDDSPETADCDDLNYCEPDSEVPCTGRDVELCVTDSCDVGRCVSGTAANGNRKTCSQDLCYPQQFCTNSSGGCDAEGDLHTFEACAADRSDDHLEVFIPVRDITPGIGAMCTNPFQFTIGLPTGCLDPMIEAPAMGMTDEFRYFVARANESTCTIKIEASVQPLVVPQTTHLLISVADPTNPQRRQTIVVGIQPENIMPTGCATTATVRIKQPQIAGGGVGLCD
ncbi:MAG: hypothetical protein JWP01_1584 [Myxococcales bacterium]|nr:hypothetical protein [Myxococcales bacterium]